MKQLILSIFCFFSIITNATNYSGVECQGSLRPYPTPEKKYEHPDSLTPIFINHLGRHGSRYPAAAASSILLKRNLHLADSLKTITPLGRKFLEVVNLVIATSNGRWGALDSLGMAEQRGIANRMFLNFPKLLDKGNIHAFSTYSPRAVMSMYSFTHQLTELSSNINITTSEGKKYSPLLRFFDVNDEYIKYLTENKWKETYSKFFSETCPTTPIKRLLGDKFPATVEQLRELSINEYYIIAGMSAMGIDFDYSTYLSIDEYNKLWSIFNLRQYLQRTESTISTIPATIASPLVENIINVADSVISGKLNIKAQLRFAHAETLMPILSLIRAKDCFYLTHYFDTVSKHWKDFYVVPMAANLQLIYFASPSGKIYVRVDLNEIPFAILPNSTDNYAEWSKVREYLLNFSL